MSMRRLAVGSIVVALAVTATLGASQTQTQTTQPPRPDVIWVPTTDEVVMAMLKLAGVGKDDVVYDLGCGDGKIVVAAAKQFGARGVGIDIDPQRVKEANAAVKAAGVIDRVRIIEGNIFDPSIPIKDATVVTLYLLPSLNEKLRPRLQSELRPGTRVVSNSFNMGAAWPPEKTQVVGSSTIYFWTIK
jgi:SAM-dependent methyltransferase